MTRTILHLDLDAFFCAVEETRRPELRGQAFAVGGKPEERGVVASCSYAARAFGIHSAMPMARAVRLVPGLIIVPGRHRLYSEVSRQVMQKLEAVTPLMEQISIDEAFMDISALGDAEALARGLQSGIRDELGLPCSIGIASNKLVAKIATEVGKKGARKATGAQAVGPPYALTIVPAGQEADFLAPLPANMLWGVGPRTEARLAELGMHSIGDIARRLESDLIRRIGENGRDLSRHARGLDERPIVTEHETKSISQETTFTRDVSDDKSLEKTLREQSAEVGRSLRQNDLAGKTVKLKLRWPDFTTLTRQITLPQPTDNDEEIFKAALGLLKAIRRSRQPVRLIGVGVSGLSAPVRQLGLWDVDTEKSRKVQDVLDELQAKFGKDAIRRGDIE
ncbi:MAG TPA: DNA polymerase IV [Anaerolineales bacterium]